MALSPIDITQAPKAMSNRQGEIEMSEPQSSTKSQPQPQSQSQPQGQAGQRIRCTVSNCHYWTTGNYCTASEILVTSDALAQALTAGIDAPLAPQLGETPLSDCTMSCCKTFVTKGDFNAFADGPEKL